MSMKVRGLVGLCGLVTLITLRADAAPSAWTDWGAITSYQEFGSGPVLKTAATAINPAGCSNTGGLYAPYQGLSAAEREHLGRGILAAYLAGSRIRVKIKGDTTANCLDGIPTYYGLEIEKS
jgi:hypothetical protein